MSHHISDNDPKLNDTPAVGKHNITPKDLEHGCGCHHRDLPPDRLDQVIAQYEAMIKEAEAARNRFIQEALAFDMQECTRKQVEQMFDGIMADENYMNLPSMNIDNEGYVALNISVDDEGYVHFEND